MNEQERKANAVKILLTIREIRAEHSACTMREIARRTKTQSSLMQRQLENLRKGGLVDWSEMTGSIKLTPKGGKVASAG